ncbi:MAG TPA: DivIVA domain-containing protein [Candidatus Aquicultor sp.]|jgi:predicted regulator of Ras-like GTPase activity (Roadblock/LC7/MglB family)
MHEEFDAVQDIEIGRELFGYKRDDVDKLLAVLYRDMRRLTDDRAKAREELAETLDKLASYVEISDELEEQINLITQNSSGNGHMENGAAAISNGASVIIPEKLGELTSIDGIIAAWVFNGDGNVISSVANVDIDLATAMRRLMDKNGWTYTIAQQLECDDLKFALVELNGYLILLDVLDESFFLGAIVATGVPLGIAFGSMRRIGAAIAEEI